jgi:hypothetical protein
MGTDVTAYVVDLEAKANHLKIVEAKLVALKTEPVKVEAATSTPVVSKKRSK